MIQNNLLHSKKTVIIIGVNDRRIHKNDNEVHRTDESLEDQQLKPGAQIDKKYVYRVPLKCFCVLGKINFPTKIDLKIRCTLQTEMKKLFQSKKRCRELECQMLKLYLQGLPLLNTRKFCSRKILDNIMKQ